MEAVLTFKGVSKRYRSGDFWRPIRAQALRGVDLEVRQGEVFGLIGFNGAGKTTLVKMAVGLLWPDEGEVRLFGMDPSRVEAKRRFGFLPELPYFPKYLSAFEVLRFYGRLFGLRGAELKARCEAMLAQVGLGPAMHEPIQRYSKGMQQRVGLAQTLLHSPELVFLDEPMGGLDPLGMRDMRLAIEGLKREGKTVFLNSHQLSDVERLCDRVGIMVRGELKAVETVASLRGRFGDNIEAELLRLNGADAHG